MVGQEPVLYARSIRDNIVYGLDENEYSDETILEAASKANCHDFIMELPEKYNTGTLEQVDFKSNRVLGVVTDKFDKKQLIFLLNNVAFAFQNAFH